MPIFVIIRRPLSYERQIFCDGRSFPSNDVTLITPSLCVNFPLAQKSFPRFSFLLFPNRLRNHCSPPVYSSGKVHPLQVGPFVSQAHLPIMSMSEPPLSPSKNHSARTAFSPINKPLSPLTFRSPGIFTKAVAPLF